MGKPTHSRQASSSSLKLDVSVIFDELRPDRLALRSLQAPEQVIFDPLENRWAVSTAAFKGQTDGGISVDLEEALERDGLPLTHGYPRVARAVGLVGHLVGRLTEAGFKTSHVPVDGNSYHGEAKGRPSRSERRALAADCKIVVQLDGSAAQRYADEKLAKAAIGQRS